MATACSVLLPTENSGFGIVRAPCTGWLWGRRERKGGRRGREGEREEEVGRREGWRRGGGAQQKGEEG